MPANPPRNLAITLVFIFAIAALGLGGRLAFAGISSPTQIEIGSWKISTSSVGLAIIFLGAVVLLGTIYLDFRKAEKVAPSASFNRVNNSGTIVTGGTNQIAHGPNPVQIVTGDNAKIQVGSTDSRLELILWDRLGSKTSPTADVQLLQPYHRAIKMVGREADLEKLRQWLHNEKPISIRTLTGPGGAGKTRMALELLQGLDHGWEGGFLDRQELARFLDNRSPATWTWGKNCLIVVDYAASLTEPLRDLFRGLCHKHLSNGCKLRILLLEREADPNRGWLNLLQASGDSAPVFQLFDPIPIQELQPITDITNRRAILQHMFHKLEELARQQNKPVRVPSIPQDDPGINHQLADSKWNEPLYLMMAALLAMDGDMVRILALPRRAIAQGTVQHEVERLRKFGSGSPSTEKLLLHLAAFSTLCGGLHDSSPRSIREVIQAEATAIGINYPDGFGSLADILRNALPDRENGIAPILPDLLGEAFLIEQLKGRTAQEQRDLILRAVAYKPVETVSRIVRACHDFAEEESSPAICGLDTCIQYAQEHDPKLFVVLWQKMPHSTVVLRKRALAIVEQCLKLETKQEPQLQAMFLNNLANRLSELGRRQDALGPAQEAMALYRKLAQANPDAFQPDLADSLNSLAICLSGVGRRQDALGPAQEAMALYRKLAQANPEAYRPGLAMSLNNLANCLSELGRRQEALDPAQEAVTIRRKLTQANPDTFLPDLAASLINLANSLSELGLRQDALDPAQEAMAILRKLAQANPDAFLPDLAMSLNNLANRLSGLGRRQEALASAQEAVTIRRKLAQANPDAFLPDLAGSLSNLAIHLSALGRRQEALEPAQEAMAILRKLAQTNPDAFQLDLAKSLNNLANCLSGLGRRQEALASVQEAVTIRRKLAQANPDAFLPGLAASLNNLANRLSELGRRQEALDPAQEAMAIRRKLAQVNPDAFLPDLAMSLNNLAGCLSDLGRLQEALAPAQESLAIRRKLVQANPDAFLPYLAGACGTWGSILNATGQHKEAADAFAEGLEAVTTPLQHLPKTYAPTAKFLHQGYLEAIHKAGLQPDEALLQPVVEILNSLPSD